MTKKIKIGVLVLVLITIFFLTRNIYVQIYIQESTREAMNKGMEYEKAGKYDAAITEFNKAIKLNPRFIQAYNNRGVAYNAKGELNQAIADYNKAIELNPKYAEAYNNLAVVYYFKQDYSRAWSNVHRAEELGDENRRLIELLKKESGRDE